MFSVIPENIFVCHTSTWYYQNKHCCQITSKKQASTGKFLIFERICRLKFLRKSSWRDPNLKYSPPSERLDASEPRLPPTSQRREEIAVLGRHVFLRSYHSKDLLLPLKREGGKAHHLPTGSSREHRSWPALVEEEEQPQEHPSVPLLYSSAGLPELLPEPTLRGETEDPRTGIVSSKLLRLGQILTSLRLLICTRKHFKSTGLALHDKISMLLPTNALQVYLDEQNWLCLSLPSPPTLSVSHKVWRTDSSVLSAVNS